MTSLKAESDFATKALGLGLSDFVPVTLVARRYADGSPSLFLPFSRFRDATRLQTASPQKGLVNRTGES